MNYSVISELSTSSTRNAHVRTLFESSRKMVEGIADKVDTWMRRSSVDIQAFEGQGYDYGLRMLTAFARVVRHCFQAHENTMSEEVLDQKKQAESLREWNRIALHRCCCEACLHLKQINKNHLASLPLWLCEEYASREEDASRKHEIDSLPQLVRDRRKSLMHLFPNDPIKTSSSERANKTIKLYEAPLFCFWPHCRDYEIEKIKVAHTPEKVDLIEGGYRNYVKQKLLTRKAKIDDHDDRYEFIVSIHCNCDDVAARSSTEAEKEKKAAEKAAAQADTFDVIIMRVSKEAENRHRDLRWIKFQKQVDPVAFKVQMPIPKSDSEEFKYLLYLKGLIKGSESTRFNASARIQIIVASAATTCITFRDVNFDSFLDSIGSGSEVGFDFNYHPDPSDPNLTSILKEEQLKFAVAFAQVDQVWQMNKLLLLFDLIKRIRDQKTKKSTVFDLSLFQEERPKPPLKYSDFVKKFRLFDEKNHDKDIDINEWKLGCVECLRDQSIAFMSIQTLDLQKQNDQSDNSDIASGPLEHEVAIDNRIRYEACQDTIAHFINKIKVVYTTQTSIVDTITTGVSQAASPAANDAGAAVVAAHDGAGIGQAADSNSTVKVETNSSENQTKQSVKRILDPNIEVAILQR
jgi:hypothetical protein